MATRSKFLSFALLCLVGMAGIAVSVLWPHAPPAVELRTGSFLPREQTLPDFSLIDQQGKVFGPANLRGHWSLLFFGYTNCPDLCPATLATLAAMEQRLRAARAEVLPQVIFVSVDVKHDTPAQLAKFVPYFDPTFIGLTAADQASVEAIAKRLGVFVNIEASGAVDHSGAIFVLTPEGRLRAILTGPFSAEALQGDFERIVGARGVLAGRA